jgi:YVTN family beta-propeller protein
MGVDPSSHLLYVSERGSAAISIVDPTKSAVVQTIPVGRNPNDVAIDPPTRTAFVPDTDDGSVSVLNLDSRSVTQTIPVGGPAERCNGRFRRAYGLRQQ